MLRPEHAVVSRNGRLSNEQKNIETLRRIEVVKKYFLLNNFVVDIYHFNYYFFDAYGRKD